MWGEATDDLGVQHGLPFKALTVNGREFMSAYELDETGAVLVRPDGHVGWRSRTMTGDPTATLRAATTAILGRSG